MNEIFFPVVERPVAWKDKHGAYHDMDKKALVASIDGKPRTLSIVSSDYKVIHNRDVMDVINSAVAERGDVTIKTYADGSLQKSFFDVTFNDLRVNIGKGNVAFRTVFWNGYGSTSLGVHYGAINFFCMNGIITGDFTSDWKRHTKGLTTDTVSNWIEQGASHYAKDVTQYEKYADTAITSEQALELFNTYDETRKVELGSLFVSKYVPEYGSTLWSAYSSMTDVATHFERYKRRNTVSNSANSRMFSHLKLAEKVANDYYRRVAA